MKKRHEQVGEAVIGYAQPRRDSLGLVVPIAAWASSISTLFYIWHVVTPHFGTEETLFGSLLFAWLASTVGAGVGVATAVSGRDVRRSRWWWFSAAACVVQCVGYALWVLRALLSSSGH